MTLATGKKIVCITGTVWTGSRSAPRRILIKDGFLRPRWFTTGRPLTDAQYKFISSTEYHIARAADKVLVSTKYAGDFIGIMAEDFEEAANRSRIGVLVVGPPEIAAQLAANLPAAVVFALKDRTMALSPQLAEAEAKGQVRRLDVDVFQPDAWTEVHRIMLDTLGLPSGDASI